MLSWTELRLRLPLGHEVAATSTRGSQIWNKLTLTSISVGQSLQSRIITADSRDCVRLPAFTHNFKVPTLHIIEPHYVAQQPHLGGK